MKYAAAGGLVALAILFGAVMALRGGDADTAGTVEAGGETTVATTADPTPDTQDPDEPTETTSDPGSETTAPTATSSQDRIQTVVFPSGGTSTVESDEITSGGRFIYRVDASAGQILNVSVTANSGSAEYVVNDPSGTALTGSVFSSSTELAVDGVHEIVVSATDGDTASFELSIEIPPADDSGEVAGEPFIVEGIDLTGYVDPTGVEEIKFERGAFSGTVSSAVVRAEHEIFIFETSDTVTAFLTITSLEDNAVFEIISPSNEVLAREVTFSTWDIDEAGIYAVIVSGTRGNATFDLTLELS